MRPVSGSIDFLSAIVLTDLFAITDAGSEVSPLVLHTKKGRTNDPDTVFFLLLYSIWRTHVPGRALGIDTLRTSSSPSL